MEKKIYGAAKALCYMKGNYFTNLTSELSCYHYILNMRGILYHAWCCVVVQKNLITG